MTPQHYVYGAALSPEEFAQVRSRLTPRARKVPPGTLLALIHNMNPDRLAFEVDRTRGLAFDSGEQGFSHQRL